MDSRANSEGLPAATAAAAPAWWFAAGAFSLLSLIAFLNRERFAFRDLNGFTFLWTLAVLLVLHAALNTRRYRDLARGGGSVPRTLAADLLGYVPYLLVAALYDNISLFERAVQAKVVDLDLVLMELDGMIFGVQPAIALERYLHPLAVEFFMLAYSLFLLPFLFLVYLFQKGAREAFGITILAQVIATTIALFSFIFLPARGPRYLFDPANAVSGRDLPAYTRPIEGVRIGALESLTGRKSLFQLQYEGWNRLERVQTDCMPSMHTGLYLICLIAIIRFRRIMTRRAAALVFWSVSAAALLFSCVFLRYHWFVDVVAGAAVALVSFLLAELLAGWRGPVRATARDEGRGRMPAAS